MREADDLASERGAAALQGDRRASLYLFGGESSQSSAFGHGVFSEWPHKVVNYNLSTEQKMTSVRCLADDEIHCRRGVAGEGFGLLCGIN